MGIMDKLKAWLNPPAATYEEPGRDPRAGEAAERANLDRKVQQNIGAKGRYGGDAFRI